MQGLWKCLAKSGYFAHGQDTAASSKVGLENIIRIVDQTFPERIEALPAFAAGDHQLVHLAAQSRRTLKIVARKWLFQPVDADSLERPCCGQSRGIIPYPTRHLGGAVHHHFEPRGRTASRNDAGARPSRTSRFRSQRRTEVQAGVMSRVGVMRTGFTSAAIALMGASRLFHATDAPAATPAGVANSLRFITHLLPMLLSYRLRPAATPRSLRRESTR